MYPQNEMLGLIMCIIELFLKKGLFLSILVLCVQLFAEIFHFALKDSLNRLRKRVCLDASDFTSSGVPSVARIRIAGMSPKDTAEVWNVLAEGCLRE